MKRESLCERAGKAELFRPFLVFSFALFTANRSKPQSFAAAFAAGRGACPAVKDLCSRKKTKIGREISAKFSRRSKGGETVLRCMRAAGERGGRLTPVKSAAGRIKFRSGVMYGPESFAAEQKGMESRAFPSFLHTAFRADLFFYFQLPKQAAIFCIFSC